MFGQKLPLEGKGCYRSDGVVQHKSLAFSSISSNVYTKSGHHHFFVLILLLQVTTFRHLYQRQL